MIPVPERVKIAMSMIVAAAERGERCPSNAEIAVAIGQQGMSAGANIVSTLETMGLILVRRSKKARVVTIMATGKQTGGTIVKEISVVPHKSRSAPYWTAARDATLMEAVSQGLDFEQAAHWIGCDHEAAAARFDELAHRLPRLLSRHPRWNASAGVEGCGPVDAAPAGYGCMSARVYRAPPVYVHKPEMACPCSFRTPDVGQPSPTRCDQCGKDTMRRESNA